MKKILVLALTAISFLPASAQNQFETSAQDQFEPDNRIEASVSASIVSRYMWRGIDNAGPSFQPQLDLSWRGLSLTLGSNVPFDKEDVKDLDVNLNYTLAGFNIGVTDYWTAGVDIRNRYFYYGGEKECPHQLEANIGYSCEYGSLQAYTMVYGNDYKIDGDRAYSTYIEISYTQHFKYGLSLYGAFGFSPWRSLYSGFQRDFTAHNIDIRLTKNWDVSTHCGLMLQGVATSIDALSVGFTMTELNAAHALAESALIGAVTFCICTAGILIGRKAGTKLSGKASILGGIVLIAIGIKMVVSGS